MRNLHLGVKARKEGRVYEGQQDVCIPLWSSRHNAGPNGEWGYSPRRNMQGRECTEAVLADRALCLPNFSHLLIANEPFSVSVSLSRQAHAVASHVRKLLEDFFVHVLCALIFFQAT